MNEIARPAAGAPVWAASPVMVQYHEIKEAHPGCLLFFRMGDFYELFFDDAVAAAQALDIALTKRGRHEGADIPMCGVPVHTAEAYLARLIRAGFKVAICDQIEDPAEARRRGVKGPVRRAVIRVVTAGTLTEEGLLDARRHNYLAGIAEAGGEQIGDRAVEVVAVGKRGDPFANDREVRGRLGHADPLFMLWLSACYRQIP